MTTSRRVMIVDDEPLARARLRRLLARESGFEVTGEHGDGRSALAAAVAERPDILLLDVQMPEMTGLEVAVALPREDAPVVIFVTAHDDFALRAFAAHAVDYLLKPVDPERLRDALARARRWLGEGRGPDPRVASLVQDLPARGVQLGRLPVRDGAKIRLMRVDEIEYLEADANYVKIHAAGRTFVVRDTLAGLEARLDARRFLRIDRSLLVRIDAIEEIEPGLQGDLLLVLRGGARLISGRSYRQKIREALALDR
ncbi:LytR/AlgR family response regulator transcription factor [Nannocystis pusilla]|uniref:LytR/AlgR family response regulator transcription factor n=1 Tax=Nannocystis pusilla TaxID=889268 RepID=UPI003DA598EC